MNIREHKICIVLSIVTLLASVGWSKLVTDLQKTVREQEIVITGLKEQAGQADAAWRRELVRRGFAQYDNKTGLWTLLTVEDLVFKLPPVIKIEQSPEPPPLVDVVPTNKTTKKK